MNKRFELSGPLNDIKSYPVWMQDVVEDAEPAKQTVIRHEMWDIMKSSHDALSISNFMLGLWPVIERFPGYMAHSLLKTQYDRSPGDNMARRWLVRNIRVEQNHAEYFLDWAEGHGIAREKVRKGPVPHGAEVLARWCEEASSRDTLAAGMAATNYAVEGATGDWARNLYDNEDYRESFSKHGRKRTLRWLELHAAYDDMHPWEALEIICSITGANPSVDEVMHLGECIKRTYVSMRAFGDRCVANRRVIEAKHEREAAA
jgi:pyrroloquinoline quinone (PQQ) biosynthesis protein C